MDIAKAYVDRPQPRYYALHDVRMHGTLDLYGYINNGGVFGNESSDLNSQTTYTQIKTGQDSEKYSGAGTFSLTLRAQDRKTLFWELDQWQLLNSIRSGCYFVEYDANPWSSEETQFMKLVTVQHVETSGEHDGFAEAIITFKDILGYWLKIQYAGEDSSGILATLPATVGTWQGTAKVVADLNANGADTDGVIFTWSGPWQPSDMSWHGYYTSSDGQTIDGFHAVATTSVNQCDFFMPMINLVMGAVTLNSGRSETNYSSAYSSINDPDGIGVHELVPSQMPVIAYNASYGDVYVIRYKRVYDVV